MESRFPPRSRTVAAIAALVAFATFVVRLAPTLLLEGDSAELVTAAAVWGVPHAPGFPLYTAGGHAMTVLPFGELAWRVHLTSAIAHAATIYLVVRLAARLTGSVALAASAGASLVVSRAFLLASLYAEVFPLNDLFFAGLLAWAESAASKPSSLRERRRMLFGAALFGLAVAHHPFILFGAPAVLVLAWPALRSSRPFGPRFVAKAALAAALTFAASYALVLATAARDPALSFGDVHDLRGIVRLVLRLDYGGPLRAALHQPEEAQIATRLGHWAESIARSMSVLPLGAAVGIALGLRGAATRRTALALLLGVVLPGPVFAAMNVHFQAHDEGHIAIAERFTTMAMIPLSLAFALAGRAALDALGGRTAVAAAGAAIPIVICGLGSRGVDLSTRREGLAYAHDLLRPAPERAIVLVAGDLAAPAATWVCAVEHACGERIVVTPGLLSMPWYRAQLGRRHPALVVPDGVREVHRLVDATVLDRPVLTMPSIMAKDPALERYDVTPALLLFRLTPRGSAPDPRRAALEWGEAMASADDPRCAGCNLRREALVRPSMSASLVDEYAVAIGNHAVIARELGEEDLARRLGARAHALGR